MCIYIVEYYATIEKKLLMAKRSAYVVIPSMTLWFSIWGNSAPQGTSGNIQRHSGCHNLKGNATGI